MRTFVLITLLIFSPAVWAADSTHTWRITPVDDGLYALEMDSLGTKSLVVEYDNSICMIEVALSNKGGGGTLTDNRDAGEALLGFLGQRFPTKPLTTVMHSHWHPHSLSTVAPLLEASVEIITTRGDFERIRAVVDSAVFEQSTDLIRYVESDSMLFGEGSNRIVIYRLEKGKETYPSLATDEFLYFYLPEKRLMQCGCMYSKWSGEPVRGREVLYPRAEDLHKFISSKNLVVDGIVRLNYEKGETQALPMVGLNDVVANGISSRVILNPYRDLTADDLRARRDEIVAEVIRENIPGSMFNGLVYGALNKKDFATAKEFAFIQVMTDPSNANAWDTFGEVHYFMGDTLVAKAYEAHSRKIDPEFSGGGMDAWKKDLASFEEKWKEL
ncbi:hypothetical protein KQH82_09230 [bacterium]|nr:hypothetical protein [bacterium]